MPDAPPPGPGPQAARHRRLAAAPPLTGIQRRPEGSSADVVAVDSQRNVDVAPGGIRVRTHLMRGGNDSRRLLSVLNLRQCYIEFHGKLETTIFGGKQAHPAVDRDVAHFDALTTADHAQSTLKTRRISHGEELFGVRAAALA